MGCETQIKESDVFPNCVLDVPNEEIVEPKFHNNYWSRLTPNTAPRT